ncbi:MAG: hypothetical protein ACPGZP_10880 [Panacagrimonas sp.]
MEQVTWSPTPELSYDFGIFSMGAQWNSVGGVYMFAMQDEKCQWQPIYIGRTKHLDQGIPFHPLWPAAQARGATHVLACVMAEERTRIALEQELIRSLRPPLNLQQQAVQAA